MALIFFNFVDEFFIKQNEFEKNGSKIFIISLGDLNLITFLQPIQFCCSIMEFAFLLTMEMK